MDDDILETMESLALETLKLLNGPFVDLGLSKGGYDFVQVYCYIFSNDMEANILALHDASTVHALLILDKHHYVSVDGLHLFEPMNKNMKQYAPKRYQYLIDKVTKELKEYE